MNYIKQLNGFWALSESSSLSSSEIAVYMTLLHLNNKLNWKNPFVAHHHIVCQYAYVSKNTYYSSMQKLHNKGFIIYQKGVRNFKSPKVTVINLENKKGIISLQEDEQNDELIREQIENILKQLNKKTINLLNQYADLINLNIEKWIVNTSSKSVELAIKAHKLTTITEFKEELLKDENLFNFISKYYNVKKGDYLPIVKEFIEGQEATKQYYDKYFDVASHFKNWVAKYKKQEQQTSVVRSSAKILGYKK